MYKGTLYVYSGGKLIATFHNKFVLTGRFYALDAIWGRDVDWVPGGSWKLRYAALGTSTVAGGVNGPLETPPNYRIQAGQGWAGASLYDWKLGNEANIARPAVSVERDDRTAEMEITFTDSDLNPGDYYEMGLFLDDTVNTPTSNPAENEPQKAYAMLVRVIFYEATDESETTYYTARPITKVAGQNLTFRYVFRDV